MFWNPQNRPHFSKWTIWGVIMPRCLLKNKNFSISKQWTYGNPINVCWNSHNRTQLYGTINLRGHMPRFTQKNECFPIYLLRNHIYVCWNPHNRAHFSQLIYVLQRRLIWSVLKPSQQASFYQMNNFRGHMPRFILNNEHIPIFHLANPINVCWNLTNGLIFQRWSIWGVTCLGFI